MEANVNKGAWGVLPGGEENIKRYEDLPYGQFDKVAKAAEIEAKKKDWTYYWVRAGHESVPVTVRATCKTDAREMARQAIIQEFGFSKRIHLRPVVETMKQEEAEESE